MFHATTVVSVRHRGRVAMAGDGQVSLGATIVKHTARKVRRVHHDRVLAGFAGAAADAFTLFERFEGAARGSTAATSAARRSSWPRSGAAIGSSGAWRRSWPWPTPRPRSSCRGPAR